jgi:SAM-dependent methyltransferase
MTNKVNLGAGTDIRNGWINHDIASLEGIEIVHDLNQKPWPWQESSVDEILAMDVIEHLDNFLQAMEEMWRIMRTGAVLVARVPYMGSWSFIADPTHKRSFHETTFMHFDPDSAYCRDRSYYSNARFRIVTFEYILAPFVPFFVIPGVGEFRVKRKWSKAIVGFIGHFIISNLIQDLEIRLEKI